MKEALGVQLCISWKAFCHDSHPRGEGVFPYMGIGMCGLKGYGFLAVLVRNRVFILALLVIGYGFYTLVLKWVCFFLEEATFLSLSIISKSPSRCL